MKPGKIKIRFEVYPGYCSLVTYPASRYGVNIFLHLDGCFLL